MLADKKGHWKSGAGYLYIHLYYRSVDTVPLIPLTLNSRGGGGVEGARPLRVKNIVIAALLMNQIVLVSLYNCMMLTNFSLDNISTL